VRERSAQGLAFDLALPHHPAIDQYDRHPEVVLREQLWIGIDVSQLGLHAQAAENCKCLVTEVTTLPRDQLDPHARRDYLRSREVDAVATHVVRRDPCRTPAALNPRLLYETTELPEPYEVGTLSVWPV
jgi:hypothetical protein